MKSASVATVPERTDPRHLLTAEIGRHAMAKADLRKAEMPDWKNQIGCAVRLAVARRGWSLKEFAVAVNRDVRQCARWMNGQERPQIDVLFAVEGLRDLLIVALAELAGDGVSVETVVRIRRRA